MTRLTLITTTDCHFCERARDVLAALCIEAREISVDSGEAEQLAEAGVALAFLPVLTDGAKVLAYGRFSEKRLRNDLNDLVRDQVS